MILLSKDDPKFGRKTLESIRWPCGNEDSDYRSKKFRLPAPSNEADREAQSDQQLTKIFKDVSIELQNEARIIKFDTKMEASYKLRGIYDEMKGLSRVVETAFVGGGIHAASDSLVSQQLFFISPNAGSSMAGSISA